jgi:hypothetical protein
MGITTWKELRNYSQKTNIKLCGYEIILNVLDLFGEILHYNQKNLGKMIINLMTC